MDELLKRRDMRLFMVGWEIHDGVGYKRQGIPKSK